MSSNVRLPLAVTATPAPAGVAPYGTLTPAG